MQNIKKVWNLPEAAAYFLSVPKLRTKKKDSEHFIVISLRDKSAAEAQIKASFNVSARPWEWGI